MALKGVASWVNFFMQDLNTGRGVTGRTTASFSSIKLLQDGVLGADIKNTLTFVEGGAGYYSFSSSTAQMNYSTVQRILSPTRTTVQCFSPIIYTQGGYIDSKISRPKSVSAVTDKTGYSITRNSDKRNYGLSRGQLSSVTRTTVTDKTNYSLTSDYDRAKTAASTSDVYNQSMTALNNSMSRYVDAVWDQVLNAAGHNVPSSAGRRLRQIGQYSIIQGTLPSQSGVSANAVKLDARASNVDGAYDPSMITITNGTGRGQSRIIYQYIGSTRMAWLDRDWKVQPDSTSQYQILADAGRQEVNQGLVTTATSNTVKLNANASTIDNNYNQQIIFLRSGPGQDQARIITSYTGSTQTASITDPWDVIPTSATCYVMLPTHLYELPRFRQEMDNSLTAYGAAKDTSVSAVYNKLSSVTRATVLDKTGYSITRNSDKRNYGLSRGAFGGVWDQILDNDNHNSLSSAGRRLRMSRQYGIIQGTLPSQSAARANSVVLGAEGSTANGAYDPAMIIITRGSGSGQSRMIYQYAGATKTAYLDRDWKVQPDSTSQYQIIQNVGREHVNEGLVSSATSATTVGLNSSAATADGSYVGQLIYLKSGVGQDQARIVTAYVGRTKLATVFPRWNPSPTTATCYAMLPFGFDKTGYSITAASGINVSVSALAANVITAASIATGAITNAKFAAGAINNAAISAGAIARTNFAAGAINNAAISAGVFVGVSGFNRNGLNSLSSVTRSSVLDKANYSITRNSDKRNYGLSRGQLNSVTRATILDKTGYSITANSDKRNYGLSRGQLNSVTRTTVIDKTGYSITRNSDKSNYTLTPAYNAALSAASPNDVYVQIGLALARYGTNGVAKESSVLGIQNNTRFVSALPTDIITPSSGSNVYEFSAFFYSTSGLSLDPDNNQISVLLSAVDGSTRNSNAYTDYSCTSNLSSSTAYSGYVKLIRTGVGSYVGFYKLSSGETTDQLNLIFKAALSGVQGGWPRSISIFDQRPGTAILADSAVNKLIIATAFKDQNVSSIPEVTGSIYKDLNKFDSVTRIKVTDKTGYSITANSDKSNYSLTSLYDSAKTAAQQADLLSVQTSVNSISANESYRDGYLYFGGSDAVSGTTYPSGTKKYPILNPSDLMTIMSRTKIKSVKLLGSLVNSASSMSDVCFVGQQRATNGFAGPYLTMSSANNYTRRYSYNLGISSTNGKFISSTFNLCYIRSIGVYNPAGGDVSRFNNCIINSFSISGYGNSIFKDCQLGYNARMTIDFAQISSAGTMAFQNCSLRTNFSNISVNQGIVVVGGNGVLTFNSSVTAGTIKIYGFIGKIINNSTISITYNDSTLTRGATADVPMKVGDPISGLNSVTRTTVLDKTGYSITANSDKRNYGLSAGQLSSVTRTTVTDKTGFSITANLDKTGYSITRNSDKRNYGLSAGQLDSVTRIKVLDKIGYSITRNSDKSNYGLSRGQLSSVTRITVLDKIGYSITRNYDKTGYSASLDPSSFSSVTRVTVLDKIGYSISGNKKLLDDLNDISLTSTVDGVPLHYALELGMAMANGKFSVSGTQVTFYKRDNLTPLTTLDTSATGRTRIYG